MKLKFIDSKNRIRTIMSDADSIEKALEDIIENLSYYYGPYFEEKIDTFVNTLPEEEVINAKKSLARIASTNWEKIKDQEILVRNEKLLSKYMNWLDKTFPDNPGRIRQYKFKWSDNWAYDQNNYSKEDSRKPITYDTLKLRYFNKYDFFDGDMVDTDSNGDTIAYIWATKNNMDSFLGEVADLWTKSASAPTTKGNKTVYTEISPSEMKNAKKGANISKEIKEYEEALAFKKETLEKVKATGDKARIENLERIVAKTENKLNELKANLKEEIQLEKEEAELIENAEAYTIDDVRKTCILEDELLPVKPDELPNIIIKTVHRDSKDWFGINGMKLLYNFGNTKVVKDSKSVNYFVLDKALQSKYYDSKTDIAYEEWLTANKNTILDTFNEITKEAKPVNDSLKNLKFRFKDGIEIEVLDSEGKSFQEVKDEAICIHRQVVKQNAKDDEAETKEVLEEYNAPATNDAKTNDFDLTGTLFGSCAKKAASEAIEKGTSKEEFIKDFCAGCTETGTKMVEKIFDEVLAEKTKETVEDSVEETSEDKFKVIVNGKEIGIFDTYEEAEEAEKKALEAIEKGIPKVDLEDDAEEENTEEAEKIAYENAKECLKYGISKSDWDNQGLSDEKSNEIWKKAFKDLANEM